ncbi:MAG: hypothetical protein PUB70_00485 [Bacteroidales bacterium]|nr:hypothetical protein [Bacteroidales bacterium]MDD6508275.1 hypothetical protein [Bacteroidales bacterium]MDD6809810.1 hypothetical protein [Bacteroidales bacterium]
MNDCTPAAVVAAGCGVGSAGDVLGDVLGVRAEDRLLPASILDFKPRLENRRKETLKNSPKAASILDFRPRLANRCKDFPV